MRIKFRKYQGTGNDFIMLDGRSESFESLTTEKIAALCHRRFGIGADGLIVLRPHASADFEMEYYNSDGRTSSMCGNGGRCIVRFASDLGITAHVYRFEAIDGRHEAIIEGDIVRLKMTDTSLPEKRSEGEFFLDTGSPHHIKLMPSLPAESFVSEAREIRNSEAYRQKGVNVNFVARSGGSLQMRTYERGVEDETYSCGTGVTAAALVAHASGLLEDRLVKVQTSGGDLEVSFEKGPDGYREVWLSGPAQKVFEGELEL